MSRSAKPRYGTNCKLRKDTVLASKCQRKAWTKKKRREARAERRTENAAVKEERFEVVDTTSLRKYIDLAGRPGGDHLFLVDQKGIHYYDCGQHELPYGSQLVADILNRTETAMPQAHCFLASQLALEAEAKAQRLGYLSQN